MGNRLKGSVGYLMGKGLFLLALICLVIFVGAGVAGYLSGSVESQKTLNDVMNLVSPLKGINVFLLAAIIFFNNAFKAVGVMFSGLGLGIIPLVFLSFNGSLLGMIVKAVGHQHGAMYTFLGLIPHGILEFPSIIFSSALGLNLGIAVIKKISGKDVEMKKTMRLSWTFFLTLILPALLLAALIEVFVTPLVVRGLVK